MAQNFAKKQQQKSKVTFTSDNLSQMWLNQQELLLQLLTELRLVSLLLAERVGVKDDLDDLREEVSQVLGQLAQKET